MLGCPPTSITSIRYRSTISTTWPLLGCTTSLETMPQHKWWAPSASVQSVMLISMSSKRFSSRLISIPSNWRWPVFLFSFSDFCCRADGSFFYLSSRRLSMRSETTHIPSCICWLCRVSTPPATHLLSERATRFVPPLPPSPRQTHQSKLIYRCILCDQWSGQAWVCNIFFHFQLFLVPDASNLPAAFNLMTFVFIYNKMQLFSERFFPVPWSTSFIISYHNIPHCLMHFQYFIAHISRLAFTHFNQRDTSICFLCRSSCSWRTDLAV